MFQKLVSHNDDLRRLVEKGYAVGFDSNYLVVRDIPYLDANGQCAIGAIVTKVIFATKEHITPDDHQIFFAGGIPYNINGTPIANLGGGPTQLALSPECSDVIVQRSFSNKPKVNGRVEGKFNDFFEKIESYVGIISGPAIEKHGVTPFTYRISEGISDSVFNFHDTLTSRAEITDLAGKLKDDNVAIIGLGGTGSYLLDFMIKTPVKSIRAFDAKAFRVHNGFRSPGRIEETEFGKSKAEVYQARYQEFRSGLTINDKYVDLSSGEDLDNVTFAFVCVDNGSARSDIVDLLISKKIPFIDVGMGLKRKGEPLGGMLRVTYFPTDRALEMRNMGLCDLSGSPDDIYKTNIQTGELNSINAALAILKFKQIRGFYIQDNPWYHLLFEVGDMKIVVNDFNDEHDEEDENHED